MDLDSLFEHRTDVCDTDPDWGKALPGGGGVYALTDAEGRLVLLASSESVRRAVGYRLSPPPEASKKRADLKAVVRRIYWRRTCSPFETAFEFHRVARTLMPGTCMEACAFGPAWFVHVNLSARLPQFVPVKLLPESGNALGPFPTRAAAERFIETLEDLFDLCRYYHILQQAPHGQPCAYFEMGKCPAPCDGSIPLERYRERMAEAEAFGAGLWRAELPRWEQRMRQLAQLRQFEEANRLKQRLQRADWLRSETCRFVRPVAEFRYLVLQRGEGTTHVRPFFVRAGCIERGTSVGRKDLPAAAAAWIEAMRAAPPDNPPADAALRSEWIWLVSHYLFKGNDAPGLFLGPDEWPHADDWLPRVNERILRTRPKPGPDVEAQANLADQPTQPG
ncbi:MAG: hypothetical protein ACPMAQ_02920 [Phycisphaerae bacterium]